MYVYIITLLLLCLAGSCTKVPDQIEPSINASVQDRYIRSLPPAFPPLSEEEKTEVWGSEVRIGRAFAEQLDLYPAITAFKRAQILVPSHSPTRLLEIEYEILLCYYMAFKWEDVIYTFEHSALRTASADFSALHDMLLILYEAYIHTENDRDAQNILALIHHYFPQQAQKLYLSKALLQANLEVIKQNEQAAPYLTDFLATYESQKKSISTAQTLNAFLPGAGYFYLGQTQSGITAFLLNGLFIGASIYFFERGNIPAGAIFTSFEAGWYFGGIYGAGLEAKYYNERLYEQLATPMMNRERLFPLLMLNHAF